ncbi:MAG: PHP domain-containing protein, partial [Candidatus Chisholmbacteria bacterium]|nr:PHP domain-containing protein [Candidatus Chisholmbacteria bacterium]
MSEFVHLHVHSEYSLLDGLSKIPLLLDRAKRQNMKALALTDHGAMYGAIKFYLKSREMGIKPIIGVEAYQAGRSRFDKVASADKDQFHLLLLAKTTEGYHNLMKLVTQSHLEGFYYKPRLDWELLQRYHQGIIATSACLQGVVSQSILGGDLPAAKTYLEKMQDMFGDDFYLEVQYHPTIKVQTTATEA